MDKVTKWNNYVLNLLKKLPQYNENDFNFKILSGLPPNICGTYYYVQNNKFCACSYERGKIIEKDETTNIEKAVYRVLHDITYSYVLKHELKNRNNPYVDSRRQWMKLWQELFEIIGEPYYNMICKHINTILQKCPFDDTNTCKLKLFKEYEEIANLLRKTMFYKNNDIKNIIDKMLNGYRDKYGGIEKFDSSFMEMKDHVNKICSSLRKTQIDLEIENILHLINHTENIAKKYIK
jgi:hypothetical protein